MRISDQEASVSIEKHRSQAINVDWPSATTYWRRLPAEAFDDNFQRKVRTTVESIFSTLYPWRRAIDGDPAAAVALGLSFKTPDVIGIKTDLAMTVLLRCAFENAAAALVLSHRLAVMPLHRTDRARLATSWLVHNLWLAHRRADARRTLAVPPSIDGERK